jgi:hypothetical protein
MDALRVARARNPDDLGNVAPISESAIRLFVPSPLIGSREGFIGRERQEPSYNSRRVYSKLWTAGHHKIALIQNLTAVPLNLAGASALRLLGSTALRHGGVRKEKRNI